MANIAAPLLNTFSLCTEDKAFEIGMNRFMFENKRRPDPKETELLYKQAATVGTKEYSDGGLMMDQGGNFSGVYFTNNTTGDVMVKPPDGPLRAIKSGEVPATPGSFTPHIQFSEFKKLKTELQDDEESLRRMQKYSSLIGSIPSGMNKLAEDFKFAYNTLMGDPVTAQQINIQLAKGELQGLVSKLRTTVGGGGIWQRCHAPPGQRDRWPVCNCLPGNGPGIIL